MNTTDSENSTDSMNVMTVTVLVNGEPRQVASGTGLDTVVRRLTSSVSGVAAALNETVVPRAQWPSTVLSEGDRVEILTAVQGG